MLNAVALLLFLSAVSVLSSPFDLLRRVSPDNAVMITNNTTYCIIVPRQPHTDVGASETTGGEQTYCSASAVSSPLQGTLSPDFWSNVEYKAGTGVGGGRYAQLTGCIRPETLDRLNPTDGGGQYDSSGGDGGLGNPEGSICVGYNHYVEILEPAGPRLCIKCCDDPADCPLNMDTSGCPAVIPGNYFNC